MITVRSLNKFYKQNHAVRDLSFSIKEGELFALLGTNGAGKTTTLSCMTTLLDFDSGEIQIHGANVRTEPEMVRQQIGVVFQESLLDDRLTARENLQYWGHLSYLPQSDLEHILEITGVLPFQNRQYRLLSGGEKRRVDFARAILSRPRVLFLDEPTAGLDPQSRRQIWNVVHDLRSTFKMTVILTTHYMEETEEADHLIIVNQGSKVAEGTPLELKARYTCPQLFLSVLPQNMESVRLQIQQDFHKTAVNHAGNLQIKLQTSQEAMPILKRFESEVQDFELIHGSMDDVFLHLTQSTKEEESK